MTDTVVVFNPVSGLDADEVRAALATAGLHDVQWVETTKEDPGTNAARAAVEAGASLVVACGGDGTVMACVSAVAGSDVPLAVIPAGTGNLLARNFKIDRTLAGAAEIAVQGVRRRIDVGMLGEERFAIMAGIGFDAQMLKDAPRQLKDKVGWLAYVISGVRTAKSSPAARFTLTFDDGRTVRRRGRGVLVGNVGEQRRAKIIIRDQVRLIEVAGSPHDCALWLRWRQHRGPAENGGLRP